MSSAHNFDLQSSVFLLVIWLSPLGCMKILYKNKPRSDKKNDANESAFNSMKCSILSSENEKCQDINTNSFKATKKNSNQSEMIYN